MEEIFSEKVKFFTNVLEKLKDELSSEEAAIANSLKSEFGKLKEEMKIHEPVRTNWKSVVNTDGKIHGGSYKSLYERVFNSEGEPYIIKYLPNFKKDTQAITAYLENYYRIIQYDIINAFQNDKLELLQHFGSDVQKGLLKGEHLTASMIIKLKTVLNTSTESIIMTKVVSESRNFANFMHHVDNEEFKPVLVGVIKLIDTVPSKMAAFFGQSGIITLFGKILNKPKLVYTSGAVILTIILITLLYESEKAFDNIIYVIFGKSINNEVVKDLKVIMKKFIKIAKSKKKKLK